MQGQIIKILSNDYFILAKNKEYICKARGKFRKDNINPKVGDYVIFNIDEKYIYEILPRKNELERPCVANIDQAFLVTSLKTPDFSTNLLDKLIIICEAKQIKPIICITKQDLTTKEELKELKKIIKYYQKLGYKTIYNTQKFKIKLLLRNKTTVFTGQTGAGKSSLMNKINPKLNFETNEISLSLGRGKHTTRVVTLVSMYHGKVVDTPGFSSIDLSFLTKEELRDTYKEWSNHPCKYKDCMHQKEDNCQVKKLVQEGKILSSRYENYLNFLEKR